MREAAGPEYSGPAYDRPALLHALPSIITVTGIPGTVLIFILGTKSGIGYDELMEKKGFFAEMVSKQQLDK